MRRRKRIETSPATAAACGAVAGLVGGIALIAVDRVIMPRVTGDTDRERDWDDAVADAAGRLGLRLDGGTRAAVGIAAGLAYTALLGAGYGLARQRLRPSPAARALIDAALVFGASLISREPARLRRGPRRLSQRRAAMKRVSSVSLFGSATTAAFGALSRRAG